MNYPMKTVRMMTKTATINNTLIIPDAHAHPAFDNDRFSALGNYIIEFKPEVIVCIGDFADMPSLSSYDVGRRSFEGRRYNNDVKASIDAMQELLAPMQKHNKKANKTRKYNPRMVMCIGNHEDRINRAANDHPELHGTISIDDLKFEEFGWEVYPFNTSVIIDGISYCLASHHKVLTADLRYVPLKDLKLGDPLVGFDEYQKEGKHGRQYKTSIVEKLDIEIAPVYKVLLNNGKSFEVTADHRWLVNKNGSTELVWRHTSELKIGTKLPKLMDEWEQDMSYDAGWLAGIIDGEGHLSKPNCKQGGIQIGVSQNPGIVLDKILSGLDTFGIKHKEHQQTSSSPFGATKCISSRILGTSSDKLKLLGRIRPERLIAKFKPEMLGRVQKQDNSPLVSVEAIVFVGDAEIVKIQTSTKTMIVEGYAHHNCHYFPSGVRGQAISGENIGHKMVKTNHCSSVQGHSHIYSHYEHTRPDGQKLFGLSCGCFTHPKMIEGWNQNTHHLWWRGIIVLEGAGRWPGYYQGIHAITQSKLIDDYL